MVFELYIKQKHRRKFQISTKNPCISLDLKENRGDFIRDGDLYNYSEIVYILNKYI